MKNRMITASMMLALILTCFNVNQAYAFSGGNGSYGSPYQISNQTDLSEVRTVVDQGKYFELTTSITLTGDWLPIGDWDHRFNGVLDGKGFTISGLQTTAGGNDKGLFGWCRDAEIKNLTVTTTDIGVRGDEGVAILVGSAGGSWGEEGNIVITNCSISGKVSGQTRVGGFCGQACIVTISGCSATDLTVTGTSSADSKDDCGGLIGVSNKDCTIEDCTLSNITVNSPRKNIAGLIGTVLENGGSTTNISNCTLTGINISGNDGSGGFLGSADNVVVNNCKVTGLVLVGNNNSAGFIGQCGGNSVVSNCSVAGSVTTNWNGGGFFGYKHQTGLTSNCQAYCSVSVAVGDRAGGFACVNEGTGAIDNCLFVGSVSGSQRVGGFTAQSRTTITNSAAIGTVKTTGDVECGGFVGVTNDEANTGGGIENCFFSGTIIARSRTGGFIGRHKAATGSPVFKNCYAHADITTTSKTNVGGFVGVTESGAPGITNAYFLGSFNVSGSGTAYGAFAGTNATGVTFTNSACQTFSGVNLAGSGSVTLTSVAAANLKKQASYPAAWFATSPQLTITEDVTYPYFTAQSAPASIDSLTTASIAGTQLSQVQKVSLFRNGNPVDVTPEIEGVDWVVTFPTAFDLQDKITSVVYEESKMASYPVTDVISVVATPIPTPTDLKNTPVVATASVYSRDGKIYLVSNSGLIKQVQVYNVQGGLVYSNEKVNASLYTVNSTNLPKVSIVKLITEQGIKNLKVIVK